VFWSLWHDLIADFFSTGSAENSIGSLLVGKEIPRVCSLSIYFLSSGETA